MFYYTNFIAQTNAWWLRRVRPIWVGGVVIFCYWAFHRYYFFGKEAVKKQRLYSEEEHLRRAALNKHNYGFQFKYQPTLERSRKKMIMQVLGDRYDASIPFEDRNSDPNTFEQWQAQIDQENDY